MRSSRLITEEDKEAVSALNAFHNSPSRPPSTFPPPITTLTGDFVPNPSSFHLNHPSMSTPRLRPTTNTTTTSLSLEEAVSSPLRTAVSSVASPFSTFLEERHFAGAGNSLNNTPVQITTFNSFNSPLLMAQTYQNNSFVSSSAIRRPSSLSLHGMTATTTTTSTTDSELDLDVAATNLIHLKESPTKYSMSHHHHDQNLPVVQKLNFDDPNDEDEDFFQEKREQLLVTPSSQQRKSNRQPGAHHGFKPQQQQLQQHQKRKREDDGVAVDDSAAATSTPLTKSEAAASSFCKCVQSRCLKMYCDCFRYNKLCGEQCTCVNCFNTMEPRVQAARKSAIQSILERNPQAFKSKVQADTPESAQHIKGCCCKKSNCLKKYCECFALKVKCTEHCRCTACENTTEEKINTTPKTTTTTTTTTTPTTAAFDFPLPLPPPPSTTTTLSSSTAAAAAVSIAPPPPPPPIQPPPPQFTNWGDAGFLSHALTARCFDYLPDEDLRSLAKVSKDFAHIATLDEFWMYE